MAASLPGTATLPQAMRRGRRSFFSAAWHRFKKNRIAVVALAIVVILGLVALLAPLVAPYPYAQANFLLIYQGPTWQHPFGTDALGRDMLSRIIYSLRDASIVGYGAEAVELTVGILIGSVAGYVGGLLDNVLMRFVDVVYGFPSLLFSIILVVLLGHLVTAILLAIAATSWVGMARVVRGQVIAVRQSDYVAAARCLGASWFQILRRYILPNTLAPIIVVVTFGIPYNMMAESGLSILGLGIEPPNPSWGTLILNGQNAMWSYPYLLIFPALTFALTLLAFTYLGDGLRDAFDPRQGS